MKKPVFSDFPFGKTKKAALELSATVIILLILAIVMLSLGLGFIRGMFGKVTSQVGQQVSVELEPPIPTISDPITLSREMVANPLSKEVIKVSAFNPTSAIWTNKKPSISCDGLSVSSSANSRDISPGEFEVFTLLLSISPSQPNTYLCKVTMGGYTKDITIEINE